MISDLLGPKAAGRGAQGKLLEFGAVDWAFLF